MKQIWNDYLHCLEESRLARITVSMNSVKNYIPYGYIYCICIWYQRFEDLQWNMNR